MNIGDQVCGYFEERHRAIGQPLHEIDQLGQHGHARVSDAKRHRTHHVSSLFYIMPLVLDQPDSNLAIDVDFEVEWSSFWVQNENNESRAYSLA